MPRSFPRPTGLLVAAAALAALVALSPARPAQAQDAGEQLAAQRQLLEQRTAFRDLKQQLVLQKAKAKLAKARAHQQLVARAARGDQKAKAQLAAQAAVKARRPLLEEPVVAESPSRTAQATGAAATAVIPANVRVNNPAGDGATAGQCEESVAALGDFVVAAWNDGQGFNTGGDSQGYAWSANGGATWTDGGDVPHPPAYPAWTWTSDPVMAVNEKTGEFWYCGLADADANNNAIGVARGRFTGNVFSFDSVFVVRVASNASFFLDKQWIAVDSLNGNVYVTNTTFTLSGDQIDFYRSTNGGRTYSGAMMLSSALDNGWVQGSRPAVGPNGEIHVVWQGLEQSALIDQDHFRYRKSTDLGLTWSAELNAADYVQNFGTGSPGFNRERGLTFPSIFVDRTTGAHRGRVYLAWNESWDWLDDTFTAVGSSPIRIETDVAANNATNSTAATANAITIGQVVRGTLAKTSNTLDLDYFSVALNAGDRIVVWADSFTNSRAFTLRMYAPSPDNGNRLCYAGKLDSTSTSTSSVWIFMAPASGTYYIRMQQVSNRTMGYRFRTTYGTRASERGRDQRDAFVTWSDNGTSWATPVRVNDNATGLDDYLPEVGVGADGMPYAMWFDYRDDLYGSRAHVYMSRSADGGATWAANQRITSANSNFSTAAVNIAPNMGDYSHIAATATAVHPVWADGRATNPSVDVFTTRVATTAAITGCQADTSLSASDAASFGWTVSNDNPLWDGTFTVSVTNARNWPVTVPGSWIVPSLGTAFVSASITAPDTAASGVNQVCLTYTSPGGVVVGQCCFDLTVLGGQLGVGDHLSGFALAPAWPNPARGSARIAFSLPSSGRAKLSVYDLAGARVRTLVDGEQSAGSHSAIWDGRDSGGAPVRAGAYFYRLEFAGRSLTQRMVIVR